MCSCDGVAALRPDMSERVRRNKAENGVGQHHISLAFASQLSYSSLRLQIRFLVSLFMVKTQNEGVRNTKTDMHNRRHHLNVEKR